MENPIQVLGHILSHPTWSYIIHRSILIKFGFIGKIRNENTGEISQE